MKMDEIRGEVQLRGTHSDGAAPQDLLRDFLKSPKGVLRQ
jgi:hypothetical protein